MDEYDSGFGDYKWKVQVDFGEQKSQPDSKAISTFIDEVEQNSAKILWLNVDTLRTKVQHTIQRCRNALSILEQRQFSGISSRVLVGYENTVDDDGDEFHQPLWVEIIVKKYGN